MSYVKICPDPRCAYPNDVSAGECQRCHELLVGISPTLVDEGVSTEAGAVIGQGPPQSSTPRSDLDPPDEQGEPPPRPHSGQQTRGLGNDLLTLAFIRGERVFNIRSGQTLGRDDGSRDPTRVNIPEDAGVDVGYVSRWHCRFERRDGQWYVTPLNPRDFMSDLAQANPTFLGAQLLPIGEAHPINIGDRLTLADVELRILNL